jgi:hypothetical protein
MCSIVATAPDNAVARSRSVDSCGAVIYDAEGAHLDQTFWTDDPTQEPADA